MTLHPGQACVPSTWDYQNIDLWCVWMHFNRRAYFRLQKVYLEVNMIKEYPFFPSPLDKLWVLSFSPGATCRICATSSIWAAFPLSVFILHPTWFSLSPCSPASLPGMENWRSWIQASPLSCFAHVCLNFMASLPHGMCGNLGEVNGTSGGILKILIYTGTSGKSYFHSLFWFVGESWKGLKLPRDLLCFPAHSRYLVLCIWILDRACLDFIWHDTLFLLFSSPAFLGLVAFSFLFLQQAW